MFWNKGSGYQFESMMSIWRDIVFHIYEWYCRGPKECEVLFCMYCDQMVLGDILDALMETRWHCPASKRTTCTSCLCARKQTGVSRTWLLAMIVNPVKKQELVNKNQSRVFLLRHAACAKQELSFRDPLCRSSFLVRGPPRRHIRGRDWVP